MNLPHRFLAGLAAVWMSPFALAVDLPLAETNELYVTEFNFDRVAVFDADGNYLRNFTAPGMDAPNGVWLQGWFADAGAVKGFASTTGARASVP